MVGLGGQKKGSDFRFNCYLYPIVELAMRAKSYGAVRALRDANWRCGPERSAG